MKSTNFLLIAAGAALVYMLIGKKRLAAATQFSLEKIGIDLKAKKIKIGLGANNPTNASATINSIVGALYVDGKQIASIESFAKATIQPNAKSIVNLDLKPTLVGIWTTLKQIIKSKGQSAQALKATFVGNANVDGISLPIKTTLG